MFGLKWELKWKQNVVAQLLRMPTTLLKYNLIAFIYISFLGAQFVCNFRFYLLLVRHLLISFELICVASIYIVCCFEWRTKKKMISAYRSHNSIFALRTKVEPLFDFIAASTTNMGEPNLLLFWLWRIPSHSLASICVQITNNRQFLFTLFRQLWKTLCRSQVRVHGELPWWNT